ncbi:MAG: SPFH domain-containing protein [Clostridia bacterium]|nr:SPFH domain-containing protein [Clostridia bacterium]
MGLIQAIGATLTTVLADQWREYFYCESLPENVLMRKGVKRTNGKSSNTRGSDNIISNGSIIAVNDGQCMMIVDQGGIVEFTAQPGEFVWDKSTEPSIFYGSLGENLKKTWEVLKKRFTFGGDTAKDQRVYYFNIKEIVGNKYGTANPVGFRVYYPNINLDTEIGIRCFGEYSYKLTDPMLFYKNVAANVSGDYTRDRIDSQLKSEFLTALQPAFAKISDMGIRYSALPGHTMELADSMNAVLSPKWAELRGISIVSVGVSSVNANPEDEERIKKLQNAAASTYGTMVVGEALQGAASNENGAMMGFMGMNMAGNMANNVTGGQGGGFGGLHMYQPSAQPATPAAAPAGWTCPKCGKTGNTGKFCAECGEKKPEEKKGWTCPKCGTVNLGKFCQECGEKKPADAPLYKCDKCGWEPEDPAHPPKFCPECGDPFTDDDIVK